MPVLESARVPAYLPLRKSLKPPSVNTLVASRVSCPWDLLAWSQQSCPITVLAVGGTRGAGGFPPLPRGAPPPTPRGSVPPLAAEDGAPPVETSPDSRALQNWPSVRAQVFLVVLVVVDLAVHRLGGHGGEAVDDPTGLLPSVRLMSTLTSPIFFAGGGGTRKVPILECALMTSSPTTVAIPTCCLARLTFMALPKCAVLP